MINLVPLDQLLPYSSRCVPVAFAYDRVFEAELRESLKSVANRKCKVALNGIVEFDTWTTLFAIVGSIAGGPIARLFFQAAGRSSVSSCWVATGAY
jgi:hypothetical protein